VKKIIGIALVLAVMVTLCFGTAAFAADPPPPPEVTTTWDWDGVGSITIDCDKNGGAEGSSHLYVETTGSSSSGFENIATVPHGYEWCGTSFTVERYIAFGDGIIDGTFTRDNTYPYWTANTEYGAHLVSDGDGFMYQSFSNTYAYGDFYTHMETDCTFSMSAWEQGSTGGDWFFGLGASSDDPDGSGILDMDFTDRSEHNGWRLMYGSFYASADPASAGFDVDWSQLAAFSGMVTTPNVTQNFGTDITGSGSYNKGADADWVVIQGFIDGLK